MGEVLVGLLLLTSVALIVGAAYGILKEVLR